MVHYSVEKGCNVKQPARNSVNIVQSRSNFLLQGSKNPTTNLMPPSYILFRICFAGAQPGCHRGTEVSEFTECSG